MITAYSRKQMDFCKKCTGLGPDYVVSRGGSVYLETFTHWGGGVGVCPLWPNRGLGRFESLVIVHFALTLLNPDWAPVKQ